jgi:cation-transporting ATPase E
VDEVAFASARKWSALAFGETEDQRLETGNTSLLAAGPRSSVSGQQLRGVYVLGAVEMLNPYLPPEAVGPTSPLWPQLQNWSEQGLRVLLFAYNPQATRLHNGDGQPELPPLTPLALVSLSDELRPQAKETIAAFRQLGIELKVISGDNPQTVAALAKQAGFSPEMKLVSGPELAGMTPSEFDEAAAEDSIFGRISPEQKEQLVEALLRGGKRVAMMGDGVNDVLSLKKASLGIAMQSGSSAARNVADMILLDDSFAALQPAFYEGRRIIGGMSRALYLFLSRVATTTLIIIAVTMVGLDFPFDPAQVALTGFTVGLPAFFLTLWARPQRLEWTLLSSLARFVIPVAIVTMLFGLAIYVIDYNIVIDSPLTGGEGEVPGRFQQVYESYTGVPFGSEGYANIVATVTAQGSLSIFISWTACFLILFLEPPHPFFLGWRNEVSPDKRPAWLALALFIWFGVIWAIDSLGYFFGILVKPPPVTLAILGVVVIWFFLMRAIWRANLFERFLGLEQRD